MIPTFELEVEEKIEEAQEPVSDSTFVDKETVKDFEQEKEEPEERQAQDAVEKGLQLSIETGEDFDEMSTQLNPDAKEFIPISPTRGSNGMMSPPLNPILNHITIEDAVVAQSPRKGDYQPMEDLLVPSELDFGTEANARPHEVDLETPELLNLKESMQQDDKLEQEYKDDTQVFVEEVKQQTGDEYQVLEKSFNEYSNGFTNVIDDPMNRSFYEGRDNGDILTTQIDILNSVQPIPAFEDDQQEAEQQDKPEAELTGSHEWGLTNNGQGAVMDASDNFEAERFVEEIKSAGAGDFDKYVDQGLSPTLPEFSPNTIQTVEETPVVEGMSMEQVQDNLNEVPEVPQEVKAPVVPEIPEIVAPVAIVAAAAAASAVVAGKKTTAAAAKKTEVKPKAPVAAKTSTTNVTKKAAPVASKTVPVPAKPTSAPIRKLPTTTAAKPAVASAATLRPKPSAAAAPIRKIQSTSAAAPKTEVVAKPAAAARTTTLTAKKPATIVAAAK